VLTLLQRANSLDPTASIDTGKGVRNGRCSVLGSQSRRSDFFVQNSQSKHLEPDILLCVGFDFPLLGFGESVLQYHSFCLSTCLFVCLSVYLMILTAHRQLIKGSKSDSSDGARDQHLHTSKGRLSKCAIQAAPRVMLTNNCTSEKPRNRIVSHLRSSRLLPPRDFI
jgi:hypothetical protein